MASRFNTRRATPELSPAAVAPLAAPGPSAPPHPPVEAVAWTVFPQDEREPDPIMPLMLAPQPAPAHVSTPSSDRLLTDNLLDAKVRLHRKLIEEINLSALE